MNEAETRQHIIDAQLALAGWNVGDPSQVTQEMDIDLKAAGVSVAAEPTTPYSGHQFADYALLHHGKPIAVVEAKRTSKDAAPGQAHAIRYARNRQKLHGGRSPYVFFTNGFLPVKGFQDPVQVNGRDPAIAAFLGEGKDR